MADADCVAFLQEALPRLRLRWQGFRKVHGQVCKRLRWRMKELGIEGFAVYSKRPRYPSRRVANVASFWETLPRSSPAI